MKVELLLFFDYFQEKNKDRTDKSISDLIDDFSDYCEDNKFDIQAIPRVGEFLVMEEFLNQWIAATQQSKTVFDKVFRVLKSGSFRVTEVHHKLKSALLFCSDIECEEID